MSLLLLFQGASGDVTPTVNPAEYTADVKVNLSPAANLKSNITPAANLNSNPTPSEEVKSG